MDTTGTFEVYDILSQFKMITCFHKHYTVEDFKTRGRLTLNPDYFMISTGIGDSSLPKLKELVDYTDAKWICIDVANGYMNSVVKYTNVWISIMFPDKIIVAGNVASKEMVEEFIINGKVDVVKIGIGPGSACNTS